MVAGRRSGPDSRLAPQAREEWLNGVALAAARDAGDVPVELLGDYLRLLADAAVNGLRPGHAELATVGRLGREAAERGISARRSRAYRLFSRMTGQSQGSSGARCGALRARSSVVFRDAFFDARGASDTDALRAFHDGITTSGGLPIALAERAVLATA